MVCELPPSMILFVTHAIFLRLDDPSRADLIKARIRSRVIELSDPYSNDIHRLQMIGKKSYLKTTGPLMRHKSYRRK